MQDAGYDIAAYELNAALAAALADPAAMLSRFESRQTALPTVEGIEVQLEFLDRD
jgi:hypothetical protein